jgi:D-beta-D-heptose 7-phosphate kinase / D-beta-D-heptose 1-phosphate adenosyltransferase
LDDLLPVLAEHRARGEKVVFTNGCFDLIHVGHVQYLTAARQQGDLLVIAVNADATVRKLKGPNRPITPSQERMEVLAAFGFSDYVLEFTEETPLRVLEAIRPDLLVKGGDWAADQIVGRELVEGYGGTVVRIPPVDGVSTTAIAEKITEQDE